MGEEREGTWLPNAIFSPSVLKNIKLYYDLLLLVVMLDGIRKHFHAWYMLSFTGKKTWKNIYGVRVLCVRLNTWHIRCFWGVAGPGAADYEIKTATWSWVLVLWPMRSCHCEFSQSEPSSKSFSLSLLCCMYIYSEPMCSVFCFMFMIGRCKYGWIFTIQYIL
jgi:hypothetical protein